MAHVSTGVEYGLHCLLFLVEDRDRFRSEAVRDLAELQGLPAEYVAKIFTKLQKADLVTSTEGLHGGFTLSRRPADISVLDVVLAIDGDKPLFECREVRERCAVFKRKPPAWALEGLCSIHAIMREAEDRMREVFASRSLADIADKVSAKAPPEFNLEVGRWLEGRVAARGLRVKPSAPKSAAPSRKVKTPRVVSGKRERN